MKLAVVLIVVLAAVLAWATILEADRGRDYAQWYVYGSAWFVALLGLLGVNILAAALIRFPWKKRQIGFVVTHAGLLTLLVGAVLTFLFGIEGRMALQEGERGEKITLSDRSVVSVVSTSSKGRLSTEFSFAPGPVDWSPEMTLDWGEEKGLGLKVLKFYRHAREKVTWVEDDFDYQGPALRLKLTGPSGNEVATDWLTANLFGGEAVIGPTHYELLPVTNDSMLDDFMDPPSSEELGDAGVLSIHHEGKMQRVKIDDHVGERIKVGDSEFEVEIVEYIPDAKPSAKGTFVTRSDRPKNPVLELKIHEPGGGKPRRQVAFAKKPLLNLDAVHGKSSPIKFWYHHAAVKPTAGAVFLQTSTGRLYCRPVISQTFGEPLEVKEGSRIPIGGQFQVAVSQYIPKAREHVTFTPVEVAKGQAAAPEAAALVEVTSDGQRREVWLRRNDLQYGTHRIFTEKRWLALSFAYEQMPLGYCVQLRDFKRRLNPGKVGNASFASNVQLIDPAAEVNESHEVSMNEPLVHGKFTFYQSSFQEAPGGAEISVLTAAYDPGRTLKYIGSLMICGGIFIMFYMRAYMFKSVPRLGARRKKPESIHLDGRRHDGPEQNAGAVPAGLQPVGQSTNSSVA